MATALSEEEKLYRYRLTRFGEMGFGSTDAMQLAVAYQDNGFPVSVHAVEKLIQNGCPKDLVLKIVL